MENVHSAGFIARLWRFPVKSMLGEQLEQVEITERGIIGDRAYALIDRESGKVVSAKNVKQFPDLFRCRAGFVEPLRSGQAIPPAQITLPEGTTVTSDSRDVDRVLSAFFKRDVTLAQSGPEDFYAGKAAMFAEIGMPSAYPEGSLFDAFSISVLTTSTLEALAAWRPQSRFDERRFRMNMILETTEAGFLENDWVGHQLAVGTSVRLDVALPDPRCVMTTLAQDDLPMDPEILRTVALRNKVRVGHWGDHPCAGVFAVVAAPGAVRTGDRVQLA